MCRKISIRSRILLCSHRSHFRNFSQLINSHQERLLHSLVQRSIYRYSVVKTAIIGVLILLVLLVGLYSILCVAWLLNQVACTEQCRMSDDCFGLKWARQMNLCCLDGIMSVTHCGMIVWYWKMEFGIATPFCFWLFETMHTKLPLHFHPLFNLELARVLLDAWDAGYFRREDYFYSQ